MWRSGNKAKEQKPEEAKPETTKAAPKEAPKDNKNGKGKPAPKKEEKPKDDDDDFDLFGEETAQDVAAQEDFKKQQEAEAAKKKAKPKPIAKSQVCFDVKGYEEDQDFEALAQKIKKEVVMDGLVWMDVH